MNEYFKLINTSTANLDFDYDMKKEYESNIDGFRERAEKYIDDMLAHKVLEFLKEYKGRIIFPKIYELTAVENTGHGYFRCFKIEKKVEFYELNIESKGDAQ